MEEWPSPPPNPGAKGHPVVNRDPEAGLAAAAAVAIQSVHHPSIPPPSAALPP